jgi:glycosyltransferase involved in cell wall biosynthesis
MSAAEQRLLGILVTFQRPAQLSHSLTRLTEQGRRLDTLVVIDNHPTSETEAIVNRHGTAAGEIDYVPMGQNLGFAGGVARGMAKVLETAEDHDWIAVFDDDDPPRSPNSLQDLHDFAVSMLIRDSRTAAVGLTGARFDFREGRLRRVPDHELRRGPVPVDCVAGGHLPLYLVKAVRDVGTFAAPLFFGLSEIEYGLRLRRAGYSIYAHGELWLQGRSRHGRLGRVNRPSPRLADVGWRRYYSLRNTIFVLRRYGHPGAALRVTVVRGLGKPIANFALSPRRAVRHLVLNLKACRDGWTGRMGQVIEPDGEPRRKSRKLSESSRSRVRP